MEISLVFVDHPYTKSFEPKRHTTGYYSFNEADYTKMLNISIIFQNLRHHAGIVCTAIQFLCGIKVIFFSAESNIVKKLCLTSKNKKN